jgi:hypothetical protein
VFIGRVVQTLGRRRRRRDGEGVLFHGDLPMLSVQRAVDGPHDGADAGRTTNGAPHHECGVKRI